jgi:hypothetical protein
MLNRRWFLTKCIMILFHKSFRFDIIFPGKPLIKGAWKYWDHMELLIRCLLGVNMSVDFRAALSITTLL